MPTYEYACRDCGTPFELKATIAEYESGLDTSCPLCESGETDRKFSAAFVGSGSSSQPVSAGPSCGCGMGGCGQH
ncbi:MAG: zinc ribbon domain-containing protein [Rhodothermales bacterium]|nr:zinc ribbon domain-containing protein [Rhodothermales bacterium]